MEQQEAPFLENFSESVEAEVQDKETKLEQPEILERAKRYAILYDQRKRLEAEVDDIKAEMTQIESEIAETMLFENPRIRVKIGENKEGKPIFKTVHVTSIVRASHNGDKDALIEAMKDSGLDMLVSETFNANTLSAYIRGLDPDKKLDLPELKSLIPEAMQEHIKLTKCITLGCKA